MIKVHYFPGYGRAESVRMLLEHAKVPYENVDYNPVTLGEAKKSGFLEFGQLPALEIDGKVYTQSLSILRFMGKTHGYYPEDPYEAWRVDSTMDAVQDVHNHYSRLFFEQDADTKSGLLKTFNEDIFPKFLEAIQMRLISNSNQKYIVGDKMTIADFLMASFAYSRFLNPGSPLKDSLLQVVEKYPTLLAYFKRFGEEELKDYISTRRSSFI